MKKKAFCLLILILSAMLILCTCNQNKTIKIGYAGSLSGVNSDLGVSGRNGAVMAVGVINSSGGINGKPLELLIKDDKNDKKIALEVDKELYKENVVAIVGHMTSGMADLTVPYINQNRILMLSPTIAADSLENRDDYFLRVIPSNKQQANAIAKAMHVEKVRKAAVVYDIDNLTFTDGLKKQFILDYLDRGGMMVFEEGFSSKNADFSALSTKILNTDAEGVFIIAASDSAVLLSQNFYKQGATIKIFLPSWAMTTDLLNHGGKTVEGANLINFYNNASDNEEYRLFKTQYAHDFGYDPSFAAQFSYEAVMVIAEAVRQSEDGRAPTLKKYILGHNTFKGLQGDIVFNEFGDMNRDSYIYKIRNGQFEVVGYGDLK